MLSKACNIGTVNIQLRQIQERVELREYSEERRLSIVIIFGLKGKLDITGVIKGGKCLNGSCMKLASFVSRGHYNCILDVILHN